MLVFSRQCYQCLVVTESARLLYHYNPVVIFFVKSTFLLQIFLLKILGTTLKIVVYNIIYHSLDTNWSWIFFLAEVETVLRKDYFLNPHYRYYIREMKILAYTQLLESYRSLTLQYMAEAFGVTVDYIDE